MPEEKNGRGERMRRYGVLVVRLEFLSLFASSGRRSRCMYVPSEGLLPFRDRLDRVLVCLVCGSSIVNCRLVGDDTLY